MYLFQVLVFCSVFLSLSRAQGNPHTENVIMLMRSDFMYGTYIISEPGNYRLGEDISFNKIFMNILFIFSLGC